MNRKGRDGPVDTERLALLRFRTTTPAHNQRFAVSRLPLHADGEQPRGRGRLHRALHRPLLAGRSRHGRRDQPLHRLHLAGKLPNLGEHAQEIEARPDLRGEHRPSVSVSLVEIRMRLFSFRSRSSSTRRPYSCWEWSSFSWRSTRAMKPLRKVPQNGLEIGSD